MRHWLVDEWAIDKNQKLLIDCSVLYKYIKFKKWAPTVVPIKDISFKRISELSASRYDNANLEYPCIVVKGMENPDDKPYRMIDGRHRILKAIKSDLDYINAYVIDMTVAKKFIVCGNSFEMIHGFQQL